jgi:hypothetical protein
VDVRITFLASGRKQEEEALARICRDKVVLVQNGVDTRHCLDPIHQRRPVSANPTFFRQRFSRIVGYFGALAQWLWYDAISDLVATRRDLGFVLLGPALLQV